MTGTITLSVAPSVSGDILRFSGGSLNIGAATLDRLIVASNGTMVFDNGSGSSVPMQAILLGPNGQQVFGLESYVTSEAGKAAIAALIAQGYTVPAVP
jgi:hypothetical protein